MLSQQRPPCGSHGPEKTNLAHHPSTPVEAASPCCVWSSSEQESPTQGPWNPKPQTGVLPMAPNRQDDIWR